MSAPRGAPRLDPQAVRRQLRESGLRARHAFSQNFLADPDVLQTILDEAAPDPGRHVLEIGPGLGILTGGLLAAGAVLTAVELDRGLVARLRQTYGEALERSRLARPDPPPGSLRLVEGDILDQDVATLVEPPFDVVANLPYHVTSPVLHLLLGSPPRPERLVLMVQREVAERVAAPPGGMSYLSVFVQYHARVRLAFAVSREAFEPAPAVDSAVVVLEPFAEDDRLDAATEDELWRLVQAGFRERRKMLHNVLARQLPVPGERVARALAAAGIAGERRPQTLDVGEWLVLRDALGPLPAERRGRPQGHPSGETAGEDDKP
ncbi:MAG: 16S rRNA (adenine(1518)-N(6)/adenine(1519)-N(6))-dimethyltransferase RsmA [Candidatus Limnocylindrales bacterium]